MTTVDLDPAGEMKQRTAWAIRRVRRTGWLLRERETRADTVHDLVGVLVAYGSAYGHQTIYRAIPALGRRTRAR